MQRNRARGIALAAALSFALVGLAASILLVATGVCAQAPTALARLEWIVPLVAGVVIGVVTYMLVDGGAEKDTEVHDAPASSECAVCGSPILDEWRLCPHCGSLLACDTRMPTSSTTAEAHNT
ncbi:MAG: hypothetical protein OEV43_01035 [Coriobacteriia bacterium]|nr:hypothetical protein [Coriobacteriia bacterium]